MSAPRATAALAAMAVSFAVVPAVEAHDPEPMVSSLRSYFEGELDEAAVFLGLGAGAGYVGGALLARGTELSVGAAIPVLAVGAIQASAGLALLIRTPGQMRELEALARRDLAAYRSEELPRMQTVNFWFDVYKSVEIALGVVGVAGIVWGALDDRDGVLGAGIGLTAQSATMLTLDLVAEARADEYTEQIMALVPVPAIGHNGASLHWGGRF